MTNFVKVYGHPRSGNHLLMLMLARFYPDHDLATGGGYIGHWSTRKRVDGSPHGKLAGHHFFPASGYDPDHSIYIYRDGRAVASSLYNSEHFRGERCRDMTFSEYIRAPLDFCGSVGVPKMGMRDTIIQHWRDHLDAWRATEGVSFVQYEALLKRPAYIMRLLASVFDLGPLDDYELPERDAGFQGSGGRLAGWRDMWNADDTAYFFDVVGRDHWGVYG